MKKIYLVLFCFFSFVSLASAQESDLNEDHHTLYRISPQEKNMPHLTPEEENALRSTFAERLVSKGDDEAGIEQHIKNISAPVLKLRQRVVEGAMESVDKV